MQGILAILAMFIVAFWIEWRASKNKRDAEAELIREQTENLRRINALKERTDKLLELEHKVRMRKLEKELEKLEKND